MSIYQHIWGSGTLRFQYGETIVDIPAVQIVRESTVFYVVEEFNGDAITNAAGHIDQQSAGFRWYGEILLQNILAGHGAVITQLFGLLNASRVVDITPNYSAGNDLVLENMRFVGKIEISEISPIARRGQQVKMSFKATDLVAGISTNLSTPEVRYLSPDGVKYTSPDGVKKTVEEVPEI